jgi:hypothetical protein
VTRVPRSPDPTDRLLAFAAELVAEVDDVDLDTIDGEFYWRWCRRDLSDTLERLTASLRLVGAPKQRNDAHSRTAGHALEGRIELESIYDFLRESMRFTSDFLEVADRASRFYPGIVWQRLLDGERVAMRTAETAVHPGDEDRKTPPRVRLKVFSGAWTGMLVRPVRERGRIWAIVDHLPEEARDSTKAAYLEEHETRPVPLWQRRERSCGSERDSPRSRRSSKPKTRCRGW